MSPSSLVAFSSTLGSTNGGLLASAKVDGRLLAPAMAGDFGASAVADGRRFACPSLRWWCFFLCFSQFHVSSPLLMASPSSVVYIFLCGSSISFLFRSEPDLAMMDSVWLFVFDLKWFCFKLLFLCFDLQVNLDDVVFASRLSVHPRRLPLSLPLCRRFPCMLLVLTPAFVPTLVGRCLRGDKVDLASVCSSRELQGSLSFLERFRLLDALYFLA